MKLPGLKVADKVKTLSEKTESDNARRETGVDRLRSRSALAISILAALLALAAAGADKAAQTIINSNIEASDLWAFYQAKSTRQAIQLASAEALETELATHTFDAATKAKVAESIEKRRVTAARYEDEPDPSGDPLRGDGKKQLMARARAAEAKRDHSAQQGRSFRFAAILLQIAIVLGSVAILAQSQRTLLLVVIVGIAGAALLLNGYTLLVRL